MQYVDKIIYQVFIDETVYEGFDECSDSMITEGRG